LRALLYCHGLVLEDALAAAAEGPSRRHDDDAAGVTKPARHTALAGTLYSPTVCPLSGGAFRGLRQKAGVAVGRPGRT
jgi:hypothetical protein